MFASLACILNPNSSDSSTFDQQPYQYNQLGTPPYGPQGSPSLWRFGSSEQQTPRTPTADATNVANSCHQLASALFNFDIGRSACDANEAPIHEAATADHSQSPPMCSPVLCQSSLSLDSLTKEYKNLLKNIPRKARDATISASDQAAFRTCHPHYSRKSL